MSKEIRIKHQCESCGGTGLYSGMGEGKNAAIVCHKCKGNGWKETVFTAFEGRKSLQGIKRVYQANPGIGIGEGNGYVLEDFGGIPIDDWIAGNPFPLGSEMRRFTCPRWWAQSAGTEIPEWSECHSCLGSTFSRCRHFPEKSECWNRFDRDAAGRDERGQERKVLR